MASETHHRDLGMVDGKARRIGVEVACYVYGGDPEGVSRVTITPTRDGRLWGGSYAWTYWKTAEERDAWVERRIAKTRARYTKLGFGPARDDCLLP